MATGDHRLLYLAWLLCVQGRELDDDEPEPPVPPGLAELTGPLQALAEFVRLELDLLRAAAAVSRTLTVKQHSPAALGRWVKGLPEADKDEVLLRVLRGDDALLRSELLRRFHGATEDQPAGARRTAGDLLAAAEQHWATRQQRIKERQAGERRRREEILFGLLGGSCRSVLAGTCYGQSRGLGAFEQSPVVGDEGDECRPGLVGQNLGGGEVDGVGAAQRWLGERGCGRADRVVDL